MLTTHLVNAYEHALVQLHVCGLGFYADATFEEGAAVLIEILILSCRFALFFVWSFVVECFFNFSCAFGWCGQFSLVFTL